MKKSIKKLELNKKAVSNLTAKKIGGADSGRSNDFLSCTDTTLLTWCYFCPVDPIDLPFDW
ncbi:MAG: hypothetical protein AAF611_09230 [Bacteroidota bacterium]